MLLQHIFIAIFGVLVLVVGWHTFNTIIFPWITTKSIKEIDRNPKWITSEIIPYYYGFYDLDFVIIESRFCLTPYLRISKKDKTRLELLITNDITTAEVNDIARLALAGKIKVKYGLWFPEKPLHWLSILCYMLDGGDIKESDTKWEIKDKKSVDLNENI